MTNFVMCNPIRAHQRTGSGKIATYDHRTENWTLSGEDGLDVVSVLSSISELTEAHDYGTRLKHTPNLNDPNAFTERY